MSRLASILSEEGLSSAAAENAFANDLRKVLSQVGLVFSYKTSGNKILAVDRSLDPTGLGSDIDRAIKKAGR